MLSDEAPPRAESCGRHRRGNFSRARLFRGNRLGARMIAEVHRYAGLLPRSPAATFRSDAASAWEIASVGRGTGPVSREIFVMSQDAEATHRDLALNARRSVPETR